MELSEWNVLIKPGEEAVFELGVSARGERTYIRARIEDGKLYVNSFPGIMAIVPHSGNAIYIETYPIGVKVDK